MGSEVQSQLSKSNAIAIGGNLEVKEYSGGGVASAAFRHQISSVSSIEFMGSVGLRSLIGVQCTRRLSLHSNATMAISKSLHDGLINLSDFWTMPMLPQPSSRSPAHYPRALTRQQGLFPMQELESAPLSPTTWPFTCGFLGK